MLKVLIIPPAINSVLEFKTTYYPGGYVCTEIIPHNDYMNNFNDVILVFQDTVLCSCTNIPDNITTDKLNTFCSDYDLIIYEKSNQNLVDNIKDKPKLLLSDYVLRVKNVDFSTINMCFSNIPYEESDINLVENLITHLNNICSKGKINLIITIAQQYYFNNNINRNYIISFIKNNNIKCIESRYINIIHNFPYIYVKFKFETHKNIQICSHFYI